MTAVLEFERTDVPAVGDVPSAADWAREGFEAAAQRQLPPLYSFALKLSRNPDDAEDLVSDTYLRALERWHQFRPGTNMRAWLFTILYHVFVSRKRRISAREVLSTDDPESPVGPETLVGDADPEGAFYDSFIDEEIVASIEALPSEYRTAVLMSDVHGMRYAEIAEVLGVPEGTVKSRLFRGRRILQRRLRDYAVSGGYVRGAPLEPAGAS
ncbi:MAG: sigma-70 family RNA polymerase sigma factor [Gemmatimonadetes bacterium]|nr:sigma-70 family RNA polymerase sigma factor [Gemmatimonadota bacterium]